MKANRLMQHHSIDNNIGNLDRDSEKIFLLSIRWLFCTAEWPLLLHCYESFLISRKWWNIFCPFWSMYLQLLHLRSSRRRLLDACARCDLAAATLLDFGSMCDEGRRLGVTGLLRDDAWRGWRHSGLPTPPALEVPTWSGSRRPSLGSMCLPQPRQVRQAQVLLILLLFSWKVRAHIILHSHIQLCDISLTSFSTLRYCIDVNGPNNDSFIYNK